MKRRKIVMALMLSLLITVLSACGDATDSDKVETTDNMQSQTTTSEEDTSSDETVTTTVEDKETLQQETTTKEEQSTTQEETIKNTETVETTKKPESETTTKKPESETTTKKPESQTTTKVETETTIKVETETTKVETETTTKEPETTTQQETTTSKEEPKNVTREELVAAVVKLDDVEEDGWSPFWDATNARFAFCDITLDGTPELLILSTQIWGLVDCEIYVYENGKYNYYRLADAVGSGSRLYKDKNGNPFILELVTYLDEDEESGEVIFGNKHYLFDVISKTKVEIGSAMSTAVEDLDTREYFVDGKLISSEEYLSTIYSKLEGYTLVGDMFDLMGIYSYVMDLSEEHVNIAFDRYLEKNK